MKIIWCRACRDPVALSLNWRNCHCGLSGGSYHADLSRAIVAGQCNVIGVSNRVLAGERTEAWPYDESNGKIERHEVNTGDRPAAAAAGPRGTT